MPPLASALFQFSSSQIEIAVGRECRYHLTISLFEFEILTSFNVSVMSYSMVAHSWGLGILFCQWCAYLSTYLYTVYIVHAVVLMFDIVIVR